jgi:DNA modification methylase
MVRDALLDVTAMGEVVLDPFLGSGTTVLAAELSKRVCSGIEISPAVRRQIIWNIRAPSLLEALAHP